MRCDSPRKIWLVPEERGHTVADDAVRASAKDVDGPIQLAVVTPSEALVLLEEDLKPVRDTAAGFREKQADLLVRRGRPEDPGGAAGLLPEEGRA